MAQMNLPQRHRATEKKPKRSREAPYFPSPSLCLWRLRWQMLLPAPLRLRLLFGHLREFLPSVFFDPLRELILAAGQGVELARFQGVAHGAARLGLVLAVAEVTMRGQFFYIFEGRLDAFFDVPQLQFAHSRSVQNQRAVRQRDQLAMARRMLATVVVFADFLDLLPFGA